MVERRSRSPRHPHHSLREALERIKIIYQVEYTHEASRAAIAESLGYNSLNGASAKWISTLKGYTLLESGVHGLRVSDDAVTMIELPKYDPEWAEALRRVAFAPQLFADLRDAYPDYLPSDANLRHYLIKNKGFLPKAVGGVIRIYRDNAELLTEEAAEYVVAGESTDEQPREVTQVESQRSAVSSSAPRPVSVGALAPAVSVEQDNFAESLEYRISGDSKVRLLFDGLVTQEGIEKLIAYLKLGKDDFPLKSELEQSSTNQSFDHPPIKAPEHE